MDPSLDTDPTASGLEIYWHDPERDTSITESIITAVSDYLGIRQSAIDDLQHQLPTDSLDGLFGEQGVDLPNLSRGTFRFRYRKLIITIDSIGQITVVEDKH